MGAKETKEKIDLWGSKDGAAGAAVRKTVDIGLDDKEAEAKAEEEEKTNAAKNSERDGKTKREAAAKAERAKKEADEKKTEKAAKAREPPCGDDKLYCKSIKEWADILAALEKKSKAAAKE